MAKTPFNEQNEQRFNSLGLRRLDLLDIDGKLIAFNMAAVKRQEPMNETNSIEVCQVAAVLPEAFELLLSSPLLWRALFASNIGVCRIREAAERMQFYLRGKRGVSDPTVDFIVNESHKIENMLLAAMNVPVMGRDEALKSYQAPEG